MFTASRTGLDLDSLIRAAWSRAAFLRGVPAFCHAATCRDAQNIIECTVCEGDEALRLDLCDVWFTEECATRRKQLASAMAETQTQTNNKKRCD